ncbi:MAG: M48 family metallopeptidase [Minisyncoccia bacterium]
MKYFRWISRKIRRKKIRRKNPNKKYLQHKETARVLIQIRIEHFNSHYKFKFGKITIRNQRSRWGSCSSKRNLNFNYKIALLPPHLSDYIVVHELCHLGEFNHSQKFWDLVSQKIPEYPKFESELKKIKIH